MLTLTKTQTQARDAIVKKMRTGEYALGENPCPCGKKNDILLAEKDRYGIPIRTALCLSCGLMRSDPYYDEKALSDFYSNEYRRLYTGNEQATEIFFLGQRAFGQEIKTFLSEKVFGEEITGKKVFEIGCGAGGILEAFREAGNNVTGCDYGETYLAFGRQKGLNLLLGGAEALEHFGTADIIILNHTFEHLPHPREELARIRRLLSPFGILYIALPGIYSIHDTYRGNFSEFLQNAHMWHFTLKTLSRLMAESGFRLLSGNEIVMAAYRPETNMIMPAQENAQDIVGYLKRTCLLRFYYSLKKFSLRHAAFEMLRRTGPLYKLTRSTYRTLKVTK